jgi:hypothetical protein
MAKKKAGRPKKTEPKKPPTVEVEANENMDNEETSGEENDIKAEPSLKDDTIIDTDAEEVLDESQESDSVPLTDDYNPLEDAVIERDYTTTGVPNAEDTQATGFEETIPEPNYMNGGGGDIPHNTGEGGDTQGQNNTGGGQEGFDWGDGGDTSQDSHKSDNLKDLSPNQKRKAAQQTADAIINTYANVVPPVFKNISSFNVPKLEMMELKDELSLNIVIQEDGTRVKDYVHGFNSQIEHLFDVTPEMKEDIKEPLVDVLLEKEMALTPTQRLMLAVGTQLVTFGVQAVKLRQQQTAALEQFRQFHMELKTQGRTRRTTNQPPPPSSTNPNPQQEQEPVVAEPTVDEYMASDDSFLNEDEPVLQHGDGTVTVEDEPNE